MKHQLSTIAVLAVIAVAASACGTATNKEAGTQPQSASRLYESDVVSRALATQHRVYESDIVSEALATR